MMTIEEKLEALNQIITDAKIMIESLQSECKHPNYTACYDCNVGSYDREQDDYWVTLHCPDCGSSTKHSHRGTPFDMEVYYTKHERVIEK